MLVRVRDYGETHRRTAIESELSPMTGTPDRKLLSIIIPAYNERNSIEELVRRVKAVNLSIDREIIIVDDGSTDGTRDIIAKIPDVRVILAEKNRGKGGSLKAGIEAAHGDIVIFQDADLEYDPGDYEAMIAPILAGKSEVVLGVRIQPDRDQRKRKSLYWLAWGGSHAITLLTNILFLNNAGEYEGCYKAFTIKCLRSVPVVTDGFDYDNELVCRLLRAGYNTVDVPIRYYPRSYAEGKKIKWTDGVKIMKTIVKCRFMK